MIAPYPASYGVREFLAALRAVRRPFPDVGHTWLPAFEGADVDVFPTHRGREGQYALLRALRLPPHARVGVPVFTHPVVWQTIAAAGMQPVFLDTDPDTFGLSVEDLKRKSPALDCLILIHTFGYPADFDAVAAIMQGRPILEDCAHALGSTYKGRPLGSLGDGSFFTFLFSKPLSAGGGGCAMTRNRQLTPEIDKLLQMVSEDSFLQGISHAVANLLMRVAYSKAFYPLLTILTSSRLFRRASSYATYNVSPSLRMRRSDWGVVESRLKAGAWHPVPNGNADFVADIRRSLPRDWHIPSEPSWGKWNHWLLATSPPTGRDAANGIARLRSHGVGARLIYRYSPEGARSYGYTGDCPEAERLSRSVIMLPSHVGLSARERRQVLKSLQLLTESARTQFQATQGEAPGS